MITEEQLQLIVAILGGLVQPHLMEHDDGRCKYCHHYGHLDYCIVMLNKKLQESLNTQEEIESIDEEILNINYEVWKGDISEDDAEPPKITNICHAVKVKFVDNKWEVTHVESDSSIGRGTTKHEAILDYLKARPGICGEAKPQ